MVELTLDDVLRWMPERFNVSSDLLAGDNGHFDLEISWAVTIRAMMPVLPPLRGNELIVAPASVLSELAERESVGWLDVLDHLQTQPVSAVLTDSIATTAVGTMPIVAASWTIDTQTELELNRSFTERRSQLYQLGSELARSLSSATLGGADLDAFLKRAQDVAGIELALVTSTGRVLAGSSVDSPQVTQVIAEAPAISRKHHSQRDWIGHMVQAAGLPAGVLLLAAIDPGHPADRARLLLAQTAEALGAVFDRLPPIVNPPPEEEAAEILEAIVRSGSVSAAAHRRLSQIAPWIVSGKPMRAIAGCHVADTSTGIVFSGERTVICLSPEQSVSGLPPGPADRVISAPFTDISLLPSIAGLVSTAAMLQREGAIRPGTIDFDDAGGSSVPEVLLKMRMINPEASRELVGFSAAKLQRLDDHDAARDGSLVATLGAYLDTGGVASDAARLLGVHRNTLSYRIARIAEIAGIDLTDPAVRFDLQLAMTVRRVLTA